MGWPPERGATCIGGPGQRRGHPGAAEAINASPVCGTDCVPRPFGHCELPVQNDKARCNGYGGPSEQELLFFCSKLIDLEDRSCRDNVRFFGFPERIEGPNIQPSSRRYFPPLPGKIGPPLEFQRAHPLEPKRLDRASCQKPIIACLLRHTRVRQLLTEAHSHGPFHHEDYGIHIAADFSKESNERRKAILSLRPHLRQLEVKYDLSEQAHMWITKNGQSKDFYDTEDLRLVLDGLTATAMNLTLQILPNELLEDPLGTLSSHTSSDGSNSGDGTSRQRQRPGHSDKTLR
ncbi:hypothetical protein NDU88_005115 [Pleurodeles waltl]|uniref:Uncharacterized protein n=1 Tax=Pleurodeles waltl TaxID=8319 RepID=A0AAV7WXC1_PLEWA|nr:hypothetical protein NDU88_005115 [Pleurodeles waltl]